MLIELAIVLMAALLFGAAFKRLGAPALVGMLLCGMLFGPSVLDWLSGAARALLTELKTVALVVILLRAGLGIKAETLKAIGRPALAMGCIPGVLEGAAVTAAGWWLLELPFYAAGMLGFIIAAVSPAVVVPQMLELKALGYGQRRAVPTLVLAGASLDDIFAITIFGVFAGLASGGNTDWLGLAVRVPGGIVAGAGLGALLALGFLWLFARFHLRDTVKVLALSLACVLFQQGSELEAVHRQLPIAALLGIMALGFVILEKRADLADRLAQKFNKLWVLTELLLFVAIGTEVQLEQLDGRLLSTGFTVLGFGLLSRSVGVALALRGSELNTRERVFCMISYVPKATVQAAMGAVPLSLIAEGKLGSTSEAAGQTILAMAVLSIVVTAPLGAVAIRRSAPLLLERSTS